MYTFELSRGDLVLGQRSFNTVTGGAKVGQDMTVSTLEPFGCDRFHPGWGSVLGTLVGTPTKPTTPQTVYSEINRLVSNYMATQAAVQNAYSRKGQSNPYSTADLVSGVASYRVSSQTTAVTAEVTLRTGGGPVLITASSGL